MLWFFFVLFLFFWFGLVLKFIDVFFVRFGFLCVVLALFVGFGMGYVIVSDAGFASLLLAVILGSLFGRKVDNIAFESGFLVVLVYIWVYSFTVLYIPFVLLLVSAIVDEYGNDWSDRQAVKDSFTFFFKYRMSMKATVIGLALAGSLKPELIIALLIIDAGYHLGEKLSPFNSNQLAGVIA